MSEISIISVGQTSLEPAKRKLRVQDDSSTTGSEDSSSSAAGSQPGEVGGGTSSEANGSVTDEGSPKKKKLRSDGKRLVSKGTLRLEDLIEAKERTRSTGKKKEDLTEAERREERRAANRLSAFQSRQRRKEIIEDLKNTVAQLSQDNSDHQRTIADVKAQLEKAREENHTLRARLLAAESCGGAASGAPSSHLTADGKPPARVTSAGSCDIRSLLLQQQQQQQQGQGQGQQQYLLGGINSNRDTFGLLAELSAMQRMVSNTNSAQQQQAATASSSALLSALYPPPLEQQHRHPRASPPVAIAPSSSSSSSSASSTSSQGSTDIAAQQPRRSATDSSPPAVAGISLEQIQRELLRRKLSGIL